MKKIKLVKLFVFVFVVLYSFMTFAGDWIADGTKWKYSEDGVFATNTWKLIKQGNDYQNYYFDDEGHMVKGVYKIDGSYYSFRKDGSSNSKGKITIDGEVCETSNRGLIDDYPPNCEQSDFKGEWATENGKYKYIVNGVPIVSNWRLISSEDAMSLNWYYFDENGYMLTGLQCLPDKNFYYFGNSGAAVSHKVMKIYEFENCETKEKGQVLSLPNGFNKEEYESLAKESQESKAIEQSLEQVQASIEASHNAAFEAQFNPTLAPEEQARLDESKKLEAEAEKAQKAKAEAEKLTFIGTKKDKVVVEGEGKGKITVSYVVPILKGANADVYNDIITRKLKELFYIEIESRYGMTTDKLTKNISHVSVAFKYSEHIVIMSFSGDMYFTVYLDTNSNDMWVA